MVKSVLIDDYVHLKIVEEQLRLLEMKIKRTMSDITADSIVSGLKRNNLKIYNLQEINTLNDYINSTYIKCDCPEAEMKMLITEYNNKHIGFAPEQFINYINENTTWKAEQIEIINVISNEYDSS